MQFQIDHRKNKRLHKLYIGYALQQIPIIEAFITEMQDMSNVDASIIAGAVDECYRNNIKNDAAWFEAAALYRAGVTELEDEEA